MQQLNRRPPPGWAIALALGTGVLIVSCAAVLIRLAFEAAGGGSIGLSLSLAAIRLVVAAVIVLPAWRAVRAQRPGRAALTMAALSGLCLAGHFASWISSFAYTTIAASTTVVTTNPIWVALLGWACLGEKPGRATMAGIAIAVTGGVLIALGDARGTPSAPNPLLGDALALVGAWTFSGYLLLGREAQRRGLGTWSFVAVSYAAAAIALLPGPWLAGASAMQWPAPVYLCAVLLAVGPQVLGHGTLHWAVRWISPALVALAILLEPVLASLLGYFVFGEAPGGMVFVGAAVLLCGVAVAVRGGRRPEELPG